MVFPGDLETALQEDSTQLSPEVNLQARIKNDEINRSLGLSPEQDPSDEELMDFDVGQIVEDSNSNYFSEEELQKIALKNQFLDAEIGQQEDSNKVENPGSASTGSEQFISQVEVVTLNETDMSCQMEVEAGGIGLIIPPELHDNLAAGGLKLVLEPVMPTVPGQSVTFNITIYYIDTLNGTDKQAVKDSIPPNLYSILSCLGKSVVPPIEWNKEIEVILVPRQTRKNNDCGPCVNEIARAFARDPEGFMAGEIDVNFDSLSLRCTQASTLVKWLHHDVCDN